MCPQAAKLALAPDKRWPGFYMRRRRLGIDGFITTYPPRIDFISERVNRSQRGMPVTMHW
jgi:hypothetical protein